MSVAVDRVVQMPSLNWPFVCGLLRFRPTEWPSFTARVKARGTTENCLAYCRPREAHNALGFKGIMLGLRASQRVEAHGRLLNLFLNLPVTASEISQVSLSFAGL